MTIKFSDEVEAKLVMKIAEGIQHTCPRNNFIMQSHFHWADELLQLIPEDSKVKVERYLGERGLSNFIYTIIDSQFFSGERKVDVKANIPLGNYDFCKNLIKLSQGLVARLRSLPERYRATAALPIQFCQPLVGRAGRSFELPSGIVISQGGDLPGNMPVHSEDIELDKYLFTDIFGFEQDPPREIDDSRYYFSMPMLGFAVHSSSSSLGRSFEDHLRAFYGAAMAKNLLGYNWNVSGKSLPYIMIHDEKSRLLIQTERLEEDLLRFEYHCGTLAFCEREGSNMPNAFEENINQIGTIFREDVDCRRLLTACIWFFRVL